MALTESEEQQLKITGPPMLIATRVLDPGPARVGRLFGNLTLPRTVELPTLMITGAALFFGIVVGAIVGGLTAMLYGGMFFGIGGYILATYSPLEGESMLRYLGLSIRSSQNTVRIGDEKFQVAVGTHPIPVPQPGRRRVVASMVDVPPSQYDRRGVRFSAKAGNLEEMPETGAWVPAGGVRSADGSTLHPGPAGWVQPPAGHALPSDAEFRSGTGIPAGVSPHKQRRGLAEAEAPPSPAAVGGSGYAPHAPTPGSPATPSPSLPVQPPPVEQSRAARRRKSPGASPPSGGALPVFRDQLGQKSGPGTRRRN